MYDDEEEDELHYEDSNSIIKQPNNLIDGIIGLKEEGSMLLY